MTMMVEIGGSAQVMDLTHLDFKHETPCESVKGCDRNAVALVITRCCRSSIALCQTHIDSIKRFFARNEPGGIACKVCGTKNVAFPEVRPLK